MKVPGTFIYDYDICMGKVPRVDVADLVYHAYNRGNAGSQIFFNNKDYFAFENVIEEAKDGKEALEKYIELKPDLVIMDLIMPECDGIQATEEILKYDPEAKIIIASATAVELEVIKALKAGAKDFIAKPYKNQRVLNTVKRFLLKRKVKA